MKTWLIEGFLPMWAKETVLAENRRLRRQNRLLEQKLREQAAYIRGLEGALRWIKRAMPRAKGENE